MAKTKISKCWTTGCTSEAEYTATMYEWVFTTVTKGKKRQPVTKTTKKMLHVPACKAHYLESTFGLWPYHCTKACQKQMQKLSNKGREVLMTVRQDHLVIWVQLEALLATKFKPLCPWCGKRMSYGTVEGK